MTKQYMWLIQSLVIALIVLGGIHIYSLYGAGLPVNQVVTQKENIFSVSGMGRVTATPNTADVSLGISTQASSAITAQDQANQVINRVVAQLKDLGIDEGDIATNNYSIFPQYGLVRPDGGESRISGYQVNVNIQVHVRNLDQLNSVVDTATAAGANQVGGIQLAVNDGVRKELLMEAREMAVAEAKEKAEALADAAGITLGRVINVVEGDRPSPPIPLTADLAFESSRQGAPTQIEPGSTEIISQVTLYYETR